ncbi:Zinc-finger homeodomain protein 6 [Striga hermonthica]|uniref:Zinc-finger homeodomain protein 6 n=1 Tax=Striga hermonthica TaxID=68872 RepID=A0A9N7NNT9_STRHE|nr:Zinc-finger homeodomain protein 6 [Striga hermonthica]
MGNNPQESAPVKLPLAPILSTPPSDHRRPSPQQPSPPLPPPPPPPQQHSDGGSPGPDPDPDPATASASNPKEPPPAVMYKECLKNHAASMGAHVVDGCGEFMPGGQDGTPEALRCAACDCHRNFHRKEPDSVNNLHPGANNSHRRNPSSAPPPHLSPHYTMVSFGGGESSSEDLDALQAGGGHTAAVSSSVSKKRFRTKFKQEQKERMHEFATKLGWRIQKQDEAEVQQFCTQIGVQRQVFKVWMHNNKQAIKKQRDSDLSSHK